MNADTAFEINPVRIYEPWRMYNGRRISGTSLQPAGTDDPFRFYTVSRDGQIAAYFSTVEHLDAVREEDEDLDEHIDGPYFQADGTALFFESVYVEEAERGGGAFDAVVAFLAAQGRPVYATFENERLRAHFERHYAIAAAAA